MIRVGTSGFSYKHWKGVFYPEGTPQRLWLEYYASRFDCVEINSSFYHLPRESVLDGWYRRTQDNFLFVLKGSRTVTHIKRLKECRESVDLFYDRALRLENKLGAVLWQLPPGLKVDLDLIEAFLDLLPEGARPVIEFRNPSWYVDDLYTLMREKRAAFCVHDMASGSSPEVVTADLAYVRFHGPTGRYRGGYPDRVLKDHAAWMKASGARETYGFFNNDAEGHAVRDATTLRRLVQA